MTQERESRPGGNEAASTAADNSHHTDQPDTKPGKSLVWVPCTWSSPQDYLSQLKRRRAAAHRSNPLHCGCRDGWTCRCTEPPLSEHALDGWRDAAQHVLAAGRMPLVPLEVRRALWRRDGADRELAVLLHQECGEVAS